MQISQLHLLTFNLAGQREFYTQTLGLPLAASAAGSMTLRAVLTDGAVVEQTPGGLQILP